MPEIEFILLKLKDWSEANNCFTCSVYLYTIWVTDNLKDIKFLTPQSQPNRKAFPAHEVTGK